MAKKYRITHDRPNCIGCGACAAVTPEFWTMNDDGKSDLIGAEDLDSGDQVLDIDEKDYEKNYEAAETCPVNVIHLEDKTSGKKII